MQSAVRSLPAFLILAGSLVLSSTAAAQVPPGFNVYVVEKKADSTFYRGGAPRKDTMEALVKAAKAKGKTVTLVDLRKPPFKDDHSGKGGRLSPAQEEAMARKMGVRYVGVNALAKDLPAQLRKFQQQGDVYIHCMYGVNRTGFAVARYARAHKLKVDTTKLGKRDIKQGDAFQVNLERSR